MSLAFLDNIITVFIYILEYLFCIACGASGLINLLSVFNLTGINYYMNIIENYLGKWSKINI